MKITYKQLRRLVEGAVFGMPQFDDENVEEDLHDSPDDGLDSGGSKFQSDLNEFLDSSGYEPGVWYYWYDEDTLAMLGDKEDAIEIQSVLEIGEEQSRWNSPGMNPAVVWSDIIHGWAVELNAQMTQDRI